MEQAGKYLGLLCIKHVFLPYYLPVNGEVRKQENTAAAINELFHTFVRNAKESWVIEALACVYEMFESLERDANSTGKVWYKSDAVNRC